MSRGCPRPTDARLTRDGQERLRDILLSDQRAAAFAGRTERQSSGIALDQLDRGGKRTTVKSEDDDE